MDILKMYRKYLTITAITWLACLMALGAVYLTLLKPQMTRNQRCDRMLDEKHQLYESARRAAEEQTKIELNEQIERLRERLKDFVVDFEDSDELTFAIGQIAKEREVNALSIGGKEKSGAVAKPAVDANNVDETRIDIAFVSGFSQFALFVNDLERHRPVFFVHEFKIAPANQNDPAYTVTLDVRALVRKQHESGAAGILSAGLYGVKE